MDSAQIVKLGKRFWTDPHLAWTKAVETDWPAWEREFTTQPLAAEYEAAFRKHYDAGSKVPPPWETVKRSIFAGRRKAAEARAGSAAACDLCDAGMISVLVHVTPGNRQLPMDPQKPEPVPSRRIYRVVVPCVCGAGAAANMGSRQALSDILDGTPPRPGYDEGVRRRLQPFRLVNHAAEVDYRAACEALIIETGGWPEYTARHTASAVSDATADEVIGDEPPAVGEW